MSTNLSLARYEIPAESVCWQCNTADFDFDCTDELAPLQGFIGQDRALRAIQFGLEVSKPGYNLFVTGLTGTGKASAIKSHLQAVIDEQKDRGEQYPIFDWCYLHNFADPDRPGMLSLPTGRAKALGQRTEALLKTLREEVPKLFSSEEYTNRRKQVEEEGRSEYQKTLQELEKEVSAEQFGLQFSPAGVNLFPTTGEGKPIPSEEFLALDEEERRAIEEPCPKTLPK